MTIYCRSSNDRSSERSFAVRRALAVSRCRIRTPAITPSWRRPKRRDFELMPLYDFNVPEPAGVAGFYQRNILNGRRHSAAAAFLVPAIGSSERGGALRRTGHQVDSRGPTRVVGVEYLHEGAYQASSRNARGAPVRRCRRFATTADAVWSRSRRALARAWHRGRCRPARCRPQPPGSPEAFRSLEGSNRRCPAPPSPPASSHRRMSTSPPNLQFYVGRGIDQPDDLVTITVSLVRPRSRGSVELSSANPLAAPLIRANYLQVEADVAALVEGARLARELGASRAYDGLRSDEIEPGGELASQIDLERFVSSEGRHDLSPGRDVSYGA